MGNGTNRGGTAARPTKGINASGDVGPSFNRRHRNPKKGPKGSNPKGTEAQREASKIVRD